MLVIGGGIIGLEMGTVYSTLGTRLDVVEMMDGLMLGADRDLVAVWQKFNAPRFDNGHAEDEDDARSRQAKDGCKVSFEGAEAKTYDMILVSVGRVPNGKKIGADKAGVAVDRARLHRDRFADAHQRRRTSSPSATSPRTRCSRTRRCTKATSPPRRRRARSRISTRASSRRWPTPIPEIAWVGLTEDEAKKNGTKVGVAKFPWAASGRAIANARDEGFTKLIFDAENHRIVGGGIVGTGAGDLISELALAVEMGADATDIGKTIHPHPTLGESVGMAAEAFEGVCTDLPPQRKK